MFKINQYKLPKFMIVNTVIYSFTLGISLTLLFTLTIHPFYSLICGVGSLGLLLTTLVSIKEWYKFVDKEIDSKPSVTESELGLPVIHGGGKPIRKEFNEKWR